MSEEEKQEEGNNSRKINEKCSRVSVIICTPLNIYEAKKHIQLTFWNINIHICAYALALLLLAQAPPSRVERRAEDLRAWQQGVWRVGKRRFVCSNPWFLHRLSFSLLHVCKYLTNNWMTKCWNRKMTKIRQTRVKKKLRQKESEYISSNQDYRKIIFCLAVTLLFFTFVVKKNQHAVSGTSAKSEFAFHTREWLRAGRCEKLQSFL